MSQHTYAMVKPGYEEFWGKVVQRIIDEGLEIVRMKTMQFDDDFASKFYAEHVGKPFYPELSGYMTSGPILAFELAGENAIAKWREIIGPTKKEVALEQAPDSLRALYARSTTENLVHGSDGVESAKREIELVFHDEIEQENGEDQAQERKVGDQPNKEEGEQNENQQGEQKKKSKCCILL